MTPRHQNQTVFGPHAKTKSISTTHTRNKSIDANTKTEAISTPPQKGIHFWPSHEYQVDFDPPCWNQVNFDPPAEIKSISIPHAEIKSISIPESKIMYISYAWLIEGLSPSYVASLCISANIFPRTDVSRLSRVCGRCRVSCVLCAMCRAWSLECLPIFFLLLAVLGFIRERPLPWAPPYICLLMVILWRQRLCSFFSYSYRGGPSS